MSALSDIVAKFRKGSPNIAAAFDEVERRLILIEENCCDNPPDPDPPSQYGDEIPPPPVTAPVGSRTDVATVAELRSALMGTATWIRITQPLTVGGDLTINRRATAAAPLWLEGGKLTDCRIMVDGATYLRVDAVELAGGYDGVKVIGDASKVVLSRLNVHDIKLIGLLVPTSGNVSDLHVLDTRFARCGYAYAQHGLAPNQTHSIYIGKLARGVFANVFSENPQAYSMQLYPGPVSDVLVTGFTSRGGVTRGGMVVQGVTGLKVVGYVCENAPTDAVLYYGGDGIVYDSLRWDSGPFAPGLTYENCIQSDPVAAKGHVMPARYGLLPAKDIDGRPRLTADAGAFAL